MALSEVRNMIYFKISIMNATISALSPQELNTKKYLKAFSLLDP